MNKRHAPTTPVLFQALTNFNWKASPIDILRLKDIYLEAQKTLDFNQLSSQEESLLRLLEKIFKLLQEIYEDRIRLDFLHQTGLKGDDFDLQSVWYDLTCNDYVESITMLRQQISTSPTQLPNYFTRNTSSSDFTLTINQMAYESAKQVNENETHLYRIAALKIIADYINGLSHFNFYGQKRALELAATLSNCYQCNTTDSLKQVIAQFIKDGQTAADKKAYNFFRSPSRCSGIDRTSLRGMFIDNFMPKHYFAKANDGLRIAHIKTLLKAAVTDIKNRIVFTLKKLSTNLSKTEKSQQQHSKLSESSPSPHASRRRF